MELVLTIGIIVAALLVLLFVLYAIGAALMFRRFDKSSERMFSRPFNDDFDRSLGRRTDFPSRRRNRL